MPAPVVTRHSPAEMRRIAWSLVMATLQEADEGLSADEAAILTGSLEPLDLSQLCVELIHLSAMLWQEKHATLADARMSARLVALQIAEME